MSNRGHSRERAVCALYRSWGWWTIRAAGSLGDVDVLALKSGEQPRMIEVKSTAAGPYEHFGPADRRGLLDASELAGAQPWLCWWPSRRDPVWIPAHQFPPARKAVAA